MRPALPPAWSFGLWLTTSFTTDYDEGTVSGFIDGMAERNLPLHVFHFDCFWIKGSTLICPWMSFVVPLATAYPFCGLSAAQPCPRGRLANEETC
jgi:hypothetical protein